MRVPTWAWIAWGVSGVLLEAWAIANGLAGDTLTEVLLRSIPGWVIYSTMGWLMGWLMWHFRKAR